MASASGPVAVLVDLKAATYAQRQQRYRHRLDKKVVMKLGGGCDFGMINNTGMATATKKQTMNGNDTGSGFGSGSGFGTGSSLGDGGYGPGSGSGSGDGGGHNNGAGGGYGRGDGSGSSDGSGLNDGFRHSDKDADVDYSDIPPLDESFWTNVVLSSGGSSCADIATAAVKQAGSA